MARLPRYVVPGSVQHVIQRGNNRSPLFFAGTDYATFLAWLNKAAHQYGCEIHSYVLMTSHVHLLATPRSATSLPHTMQSLGGGTCSM